MEMDDCPYELEGALYSSEIVERALDNIDYGCTKEDRATSFYRAANMRRRVRRMEKATASYSDKTNPHLIQIEEVINKFYANFDQ